MSSITVLIKTPRSEFEVHASPNMSFSQLVSWMIAEPAFPEKSVFPNKTVLTLRSERLGRSLSPFETLFSAGISQGDILILQGLKNADRISVKVLLVFDKSCTTVNFPTNATIAGVIEDLLRSGSYDRENNLGETFEYVLASKTRGKVFTDPGKTLGNYGVLNGHILLLYRNVTAGGGSPRKVNKTPLGLRLDRVKSTHIKTLQADKHALNMTLYSYRDTLEELENAYVELHEAEEKIERLEDRMKDKNIATGLFILGQIQIGFGTNMITGNAMGGWFIFISGAAVTMGALYYSFIGPKRTN